MKKIDTKLICKGKRTRIAKQLENICSNNDRTFKINGRHQITRSMSWNMFKPG